MKLLRYLSLGLIHPKITQKHELDHKGDLFLYFIFERVVYSRGWTIERVAKIKVPLESFHAFETF